METIQIGREVRETKATASHPAGGQPGINRREFLTYAWGTALGLLTLETGATTYTFLHPRFRAGEFGGKFPLGTTSTLPQPNTAPAANPTGKFWLVNTEEGPKALYMVCTHLGCLYKWQPSLGIFRCPCHGSEFSREGHLLKGPATRSLDQFAIEVVREGEVVAETTASPTGPIAPPETTPDVQIVVNTGKRIKGTPVSTRG